MIEKKEKYETPKEVENSENHFVVGISNPENEKTLKGRIRICAELAGSGEALSQKTGIPRSTLETYLTGKSEPKAGRLASIARAAGVTVDWLVTGEGPRAPVAAGRPLGDHAPSDEYAYLPLYNVRAAAGHGSIVEDEQVIDSLAFKKEWIHNELHANPADLYLLYVHGDSMEPALRAGDVILVNRRCSTVQHDGVFVLVMDGTLLVKRLQSLPGGRIRVSSDNPSYQPFEIEKTWLHNNHHVAEEGAGIIGRVVWAGRRM